MGMMRILDETGDTRVMWEAADPVSVQEAERIFERLLERRQMAFARPADAPASQATMVRQFDPAAAEIIWVRPIQGG